MTLEECPVTLDELKRQLRLPDAEGLDLQLEVALLAAAEWCETFSGRKLSDFEELPAMLRAAILLKAGDLFENPTDQVSERTTAAQRLADPLIWQKTTTSEDSQSR